MPDYSKGKIYKIVCNTTGLVYYGSTVASLKHRLNQHITNHKHDGVTTSKIVIENNNYEIILLENYPCKTRKELEKKESWYIQNNECVNKMIPGRTLEEWYIDNREHVINKSKRYYNDNKKKVLEKVKIYSSKNKEKISKYYKQWGLDNREDQSEKKKTIQI